MILVFPGGSDGKASARNAGDPGSIPGLGRSPGEGNGNPHQYSCLENSMDGGAWWATVHGVTKSWTRPSDVTTSMIVVTLNVIHSLLHPPLVKSTLIDHAACTQDGGKHSSLLPALSVSPDS